MPSSTARRREMLWRKGVRWCARCGQPLDGPHHATLEHIVPKSAGGRTVRSNLSLSHPECNHIAGSALWCITKHHRPGIEMPRSADFWYQDLQFAMPSSRVSRSRQRPFQILTAIEAAETIAEGSGIDELESLVARHGKGSWLKKKGRAVVRFDDGTIRRVELHWYEAHGIGRRDLKIKRFLDL